MGVANHVRQDVLHDAGVHVGQVARRRGQGGVEQLARCIGDGLPDRARANVLDVVQHIAEHLLALAAKRRPVARVEVACDVHWLWCV
jgi:hypothetical protein